MQERKSGYLKSKIAYGLIKVALIFSVIVFSAYNNGLHSAFQESVKTELVFSKKASLFKSILDFDKSFEKTELIPDFPYRLDALKFAISNQEQSLDVAYKSLKQSFLSYKHSLSPASFRLNFLQSDTNADNLG